MINTVNGPVVVGIDGSDEAARAASYGAWEATRRQVALRLVFAHQPTPMWGPAMLLQDDYEWVADWVREILVKAEKAVTAAHPDTTVETAAISGGPAAALVDESRRASLVVIGTRATGGLVGHLSGSVAAQVAAHAHAPVVVLRPNDPDATDSATFSTSPVVVGLDGSPEAQLALAFAVEESAGRGAELHAVYAWNLLDVRDIGPIVPDGYEAADEEEKALRLLTEATEGWSDRYPELVIKRRVMHSLNPVDALTKASDGAGLLVVGSRGHGGFLGLRLGSTVDGLIRHAGAPVAVVRGEPTP
jgi:nucleotide-binding universal stress UspA family protein